jgi:peptidoglycan/LPS O-acetylase OafA/YrhL
MPGLDGLRAVAVLGVLVYHLGFARAQGGLLGVGVFFTLSGYLITDILLGQVEAGGIRLKSFWLARARRLLPALFLVLAVVVAWVTVIGPHQPSGFRSAAASAALYFNNWWQVIQEASYFARFDDPGPINHLWSLSVEEQFYIVWPLLLIVATKLLGGTGARFTRPSLVTLSLGLAAASGVLMYVLYTPGVDPTRIYYGTDTRAMELLVGAALAAVWPSQRLRPGISVARRRALDAAGAIGLVVIALMFWRTTEFSTFLYRGGFLVLAVATALAVAAMAHPASRLGPLLGWGPMRWIGERSYGIYLWHFPIIILTTPGGVPLGNDLPRAAAQVAATFVAAGLSWRYVENPIRHGALRRLWSHVRNGRLRERAAAAPRAAWAALAAAGVVFAAALAGMAGANQEPETKDVQVLPFVMSETLTAPGPAPGAPVTACEEVIHIGDSTSIGLVSQEYGGDDDLISRQYGRVGAVTQHIEVAGARSIAEPFEGPVPNAEKVARSWIDAGYRGCWVLALGLNEAGNVAVGSQVGHVERIRSMMDLIGDQPVLWINVRTVNATGPFADANARAWNDALEAECAGYPEMRIYDWASEVPDEYFTEDGAHFTGPGNVARGRWIADALAEAFPAEGRPPRGCLVDLRKGSDRIG